MAWHVGVYVTLKPSVMDPQGATVQRALNQMGYKGVSGVRMGKFTELEFDANRTLSAAKLVIVPPPAR